MKKVLGLVISDNQNHKGRAEINSSSRMIMSFIKRLNWE
jgi:hypothetical protein